MKGLKRVLSFLGWLVLGFLMGVVSLFGIIFISYSPFGLGIVFLDTRFLVEVTILCGALYLGVVWLIRERRWDLRAKAITAGSGLFLATLWIVTILLERIFMAFN